MTFDRFHLSKIINAAVDEVRKNETQETPLLTKTKYLWLKNDLTADQKKFIDELCSPRNHLKTARAYKIKLSFQDTYKQADNRDAAELLLNKWYFWATHSRIQPIIDAAKTIKRHWAGVLRWFDSHLTNGILEGINSLVQAAKARARGYRNIENFKAMIFLIAGKLEFQLPI